MASQNSEIFRQIDDGIYNIAKQPAPVDRDTVFRYSSYACANSGSGAGTAAAPLNYGTNQTTFSLNQQSGAHLRFGTLGLRLKMIFTDVDSVATCPLTDGEATAITKIGGLPSSAPSWNLCGAFVSQMVISMNGVPIYSSVSGHFLEDWTAKLIYMYSHDELDNHPGIFGPIGDTSYTGYSARAAAAVEPSGTVVQSIYPNQLMALSAPYVKLAKHATTIDSASTFVGFNPSYNPKAEDPCLKARAMEYCGGANTHLRVITKIIPLRDILPIPDAVYANLRTLDIKINWVNDLDLLDHFNTTVATQSGVRLLNCDLVTDSYMMSIPQSITSITEKGGAQSEILPYYNTMMFNPTYIPGSDLRLPNVSNCQAIFIMQLAKDFTNGQSATSEAGYSSTAQFLLFGDSSSTLAVNDLRLKADAIRAIATDASPISDVQVSIGGRDYPSTPIITSNALSAATICFDPSQLYMEYCKAVGKFCRRDVSPAITYSQFKSVCPFICIRPYADNALHLSDARDITIRMHGGIESKIVIICFCLGVCTLAADGTAKIY